MDVCRLRPGRAIISTLIADTIDLTEYLEDKHEGENIRPADFWRDQVHHIFQGGGQSEGAVLPWSKTHEDIRLRMGEVSLWHGMNGHGKSMVTGQVALDLMWQGFRVCIASMEMLPAKTLARMNRQAAGVSQPDSEVINAFHDWTDERLWLYDRRGRVDWKKVSAVIRYSVDKFDCHHFFVDSLMKCVKDEDDYNGQKEFVNDLCCIAQDLQIHIHLIHHTKKPQHGEESVPGKYDAKGSGSIVDQVDNVFGVWRNKKKEQERREGQQVDETKPDQLIICDKQRNGEWEGKIGLWFNPSGFQYRGDFNNFRTRQYIGAERRAA